MDNSLIGEHHGFIPDLLVQGQDVIVDERALRVEKQTEDAGPGPDLCWETGPSSPGSSLDGRGLI